MKNIDRTKLVLTDRLIDQSFKETFDQPEFYDEINQISEDMFLAYDHNDKYPVIYKGYIK